MAFNYQSAGPAGQTPLSPTSKDIQCRSFKLDFSQTNATTAVAFDIGWLPKDAQVVHAWMIPTVAVSGPSVTAATAVITVGGANLFAGFNAFTIGGRSGPSSSGYFGTLPTTTDQKIQGTLTLTGGTVANAGILYLNIFYVI